MADNRYGLADRVALRTRGDAGEKPRAPAHERAPVFARRSAGHENVLTTFASYGQVATPRQAELIRELGKPMSEAVDLHALVRDVTRIKESLPG